MCVCVCLVWCICIHNCLASCCAPIRGSIPPGLEGGEVFCYADTIDGNCRPTKNLKMWPPMCVRTSSHFQWLRVQNSPTRPLCRDRHWKPLVAWTAIQKSTPFSCISGKRLNCTCSPSDVFFDHRFVGLATRKPLIVITSLVAASSSNPTFRHGTSDDMRTFLSRNRGRVWQKLLLQYVNSANRSPCDVIKKIADFQVDGDRKLQIFAYLQLEVVGNAKAHIDAKAARHFCILRTTLRAWKGLELQLKDRNKSQNKKRSMFEREYVLDDHYLIVKTLKINFFSGYKKLGTSNYQFNVKLSKGNHWH